MLGAGELLLFLKYYDPATEQLSFLKTHIAQSSDTLNELVPVLQAAKGLPASSELAVFEEVRRREGGRGRNGGSRASGGRRPGVVLWSEGVWHLSLSCGIPFATHPTVDASPLAGCAGRV